MSDSLNLQIETAAKQLAECLRNQNKTLAVAESCTGGWVAKALTDLAGSSEWFSGGIVSYTNAAKQTLLNVDEASLITFGAVSEQVATQMAKGVLTAFDSSVSVAITGVAGPSGGTADKPVGMVCFATADAFKGPIACTKNFSGNREKVRKQAVLMAIQLLLEKLAE